MEAHAACTIPSDTLTAFFQQKSKRVLHDPLPEHPWPLTANPPIPQSEADVTPFQRSEVEKITKALKNNTAPGYDGVKYSTIKSNISKLAETLTTIFNICWQNNRIPNDWKHAVITLLPKKGGNSQQPSDWRPISLLTSFYKIFMKLIQSRMLPWIVNTCRLSQNQKGSLPRNGLQEHVLSLKTRIENSKHLSTQFYTVFVDIKDAYGSVDHTIMLEAMKRAHYPQKVIQITQNIYTNSTFSILTRTNTTEKITRQRGIIQGCPWSAIAFIQALDPWIRWTEEPSIGQPLALAPACQAYMDDVCLIGYSAEPIRDMAQKTETFLNYTGMEAKPAKCAVIHGQRTGNN